MHSGCGIDGRSDMETAYLVYEISANRPCLSIHPTGTSKSPAASIQYPISRNEHQKLEEGRTPEGRHPRFVDPPVPTLRRQLRLAVLKFTVDASRQLTMHSITPYFILLTRVHTVPNEAGIRQLPPSNVQGQGRVLALTRYVPLTYPALPYARTHARARRTPRTM
ncbi:hypothetical protein GY45DRAFT_56998 [Cubamyces sp. BRFM 1775]|nr:hypothetical protein GY45DRAFT_56998 [Cubamyces sp. BRFM 1775]